MTDYFYGAPKITADGDCSHEMKRCLLLGRKVMTNLDSILKSYKCLQVLLVNLKFFLLKEFRDREVKKVK